MDNVSVGRNCHGRPSARSIFSCSSFISCEMRFISRSCSLSKLKRIYVRVRADMIIMIIAIVIGVFICIHIHLCNLQNNG